MLDVDALRRISLFGGLPRDEVSLVGGLLEERAFPAGATLVEEGAPGRELYIVASGEADVLKRTSGGEETRIAELGPGAVFGEMALVGIMPRAATVRARTPLRALVLSYQKMTALSDGHLRTFTVLVMNLAREICRRLHRADAVLGEFNIQQSAGRESSPRG